MADGVTSGDLALMKSNDGLLGGSGYQQSQYLLGQTGRWVGWVGSGSQTAPST